MADYTYAAAPKRKKLWEDTLAEETARANAAAEQTKQQITDANEQYKAGVNAAYDTAIQTAEGTAKQNADAAYRSYQKQFDANAAQQMAAERNLREQMANMGLTQSGYNATNQTALQVARANADAGTRTARQAAVDAILQELSSYTGEMNAKRTETLADADYKASGSIMQAQQNAAAQAEANAQNRYQNEIALSFDMQNAVEQHNNAVYNRIFEAQSTGNVALARELAKELWQINADGTVGYMNMNPGLIKSTAPVAEQKTSQQILAETASPIRSYMDNYYSSMAKGEKYAEVYKEAALKQAFDADLDGLFPTGDELSLFLFYAGIPRDDYEAYRKANMPRGVVLNENNTHYQTTK